MGNCFAWKSTNPSTSNANPIPPRPSTPGSSSGYSREVGFSTTSSSAGQSRFSAATGDDANNGEILETSNLKVYSFADLKTATQNFKSNSVLGIGGFGTVFKGWVDEKTLEPNKSGTGMTVAIKKLNSESVQGYREWQSEVDFLGRLSHPNLVKLLGYCWEEQELLLVYEFMQKGSLENHLFRRNSSLEPLSWDLRLKIAIGAARGLAFLHSSEKKIIYRDFKASNILLDGKYNAKISDFGLAKAGPSGESTHVSTRIMGTYGYAAPEYVATGTIKWERREYIAIQITSSLQPINEPFYQSHLYVKSDVYGFGVVLLEMLTGLRAIDNKRPTGQQNLVEWLKPQLSKRKVKPIMDPQIRGQYTSKAALQAGQLTLRCLELAPRNRPHMKEVVEVLEQIDAMKIKSKVPRINFGDSSSHQYGYQQSHH